MSKTFLKRNPGAPAGFFANEAAGLRWLADAGGAACAEVVTVDEESMTLVALTATEPTAKAARAFGKALATTHDSGAPAWGSPPEGWDGPGFFGPLKQPLPMSLTPHDTWGEFYAVERLQPMLEPAREHLSSDAIADVQAVIERCHAGDYDDDDTPVRLHGDLWKGNLVWTKKGVVLIDPTAYGGHRETDIAMLHLFGCPHLSEIIDGYQEAHPLQPGWRDRIRMRQLFPLLGHVALFGAGYANQTREAARRALELD